jgi:phosphate transport system substrate-binding protein
MRRRLRVLLCMTFALAVVCGCGHSPAQAAAPAPARSGDSAYRAALVIGNSSYSGNYWPELQGQPVRDAGLIRGTLARLGFEVVYQTDADMAQMNGALRKFRDLLQQHRGALALVYYAGHGVQARSGDGVENYLLPVDSELRAEANAPREAISQELLEEIIRGADAQAGVLILDTCRVSGLEPATRGPLLRGLQHRSATNMLVAYSAAQGSSAYNTGSYATALAEEIVRPGRLTDALMRVRERVIAATRSKGGEPQAPEALNKLTHDIVLVQDGALLTIQGSNTIGGGLMPRLVSRFMEHTLGCTAVSRTEILPEETEVTGTCNGVPQRVEIFSHGSLTGFPALASGAADIAMASDGFSDLREKRKLDAAVVRDLDALGDLASPAGEHVIALDGIAVIVHANNPLKKLTTSQLSDIFSGRVTDWSGVGRGAGTGPIHIYARPESSGTWQIFKDTVLLDAALAPGATRIENSGRLAAAVAADPQGIGFVGVSYAGSARTLALGEEGGAMLKPAPCTVKTEEYVLHRRLYLYTSTHPANDRVSPFIKFATSREAWPIVEEAGLVSLDPAPDPACAAAQFEHSSEWLSLTKDARRLNTNFNVTFVKNSFMLDSKARQEIGYVVDMLAKPECAGRHILLIGYADSDGTKAHNDGLSKDRAATVGSELADEVVQRGLNLTVDDVHGLGSLDPIGDNRTPEGKARNRRVEIWVRPPR